MGNLESTDGGPGEPPSVPLLLPPGKTPMPEPCELEERFALVLVRPALLPSSRPPPPAGSRPPPQPGLRLTGPAARSGPSGVGEEGSPSPGPAGGPDSSLPTSLRLPGPLPEFHSRDLAGGTVSEAVGSPAKIRHFFLPYESGSRIQTRCFGEEREERRRGWLSLGVGGGIRSDAILLISEPPAGILLSYSGFA